MAEGTHLMRYLLREIDRGKKSGEWWAAVTDPVNFVVGSVLLLFLRRKLSIDQACEEEGWVLEGNVMGLLLSTILTPTLFLALPVVLPFLLGIGDPFWFALTLLVGGAVTLVPGRLAELRAKEWARGSGYPKKLRKTMWRVEFCIVVVVIPLILFWNFGGQGHHPAVRAIAWGLVSISSAELWIWGWTPMLFATTHILMRPMDLMESWPIDRLLQQANEISWAARPDKRSLEPVAEVLLPQERVLGVCKIPLTLFFECSFTVTDQNIYFGFGARKGNKRWKELRESTPARFRINERVLGIPLTAVDGCAITNNVLALHLREEPVITFHVLPSMAREQATLVQRFFEAARDAGAQRSIASEEPNRNQGRA
jgi:hypothetical protein